MNPKKIETENQLLTILNENEMLYLYGAGDVSRTVIKYCSRRKIKISGVCVSKQDDNPSEVMGIKVVPFSDNIVNDNTNLIICIREEGQKEIFDSLNCFKELKVYAISDSLFFELKHILGDYETEIINRINYLERTNAQILSELSYFRNALIRNTPLPILQYFILNIVDHCNLNCKGCNHFSPLAKKRCVELKTIEKDLVQMHVVHGDIPRIGIMGGEPLLHPDINKILIIVRHIFPKTQILLSTNGILLERQKEDFWNICKENDITIRITKYPIQLKYDKIENKILSKGIKIDYFFDGETGSSFDNVSMDINGYQDPVSSFNNCGYANRCVLLNEGKLYTCQIIFGCTFFCKIFKKEMPIEETDYIDIYKCSREEVLEKLAKPLPFCRFCNVSRRSENRMEWGISERKIEEWV